MMLISEEYRAQQTALHKNPAYGTASVGYAPLVTQIINKLEIKDLLDYGCGKMRLFEAFRGHVNHKMTLQAYDPAIPERATRPVPSNMVTCIDVLEHIEPDFLDAVLDDLKDLTLFVGFFSVHCGPAMKVLPDGRNAHLIQEPPEWWLPKFIDRFELQTFQRVPNGFYVIVYNKQQLVLS